MRTDQCVSILYTSSATFRADSLARVGTLVTMWMIQIGFENINEELSSQRL